MQNPQIENELITRFKIISKMCSVLIGIIAIAALLGWVFDISYLKSIYPNFITMKFNAALCFLLISLALLSLHNAHLRWHRTIAILLASIVLVISILTMIEYAFNVDLHFDEILFVEPPGPTVFYPPGRIAPVTAIAFSLSSIAILISIKKSTIAMQIIAILIALFGILVLSAFTYSAQTHTPIAYYIYSAIHAAINFILIAIALLFLRPNQGIIHPLVTDTDTGYTARRLIPLAIILPIIIGYLVMLGHEIGKYQYDTVLAVYTTIIVAMVLFIAYLAVSMLLHADIRRMQAEALLSESEQRWKFALEGGSQGVWDWDLKTNFVFYSPNWKKLLGYDVSQTFNRFDDFKSLIHPDDAEDTLDALNEHLLGHTADYLSEHRMRCGDGHYKWVLDRGKIIERDIRNKPTRAMGTITDIERIKLAEQHAEVLSKRLQMALDVGQIGIWEFNVQTYETSWDEQMRRLYNLPGTMTTVSYQTWKNCLHPDDVIRVEGELKRAIEGIKPYDTEFRIITPQTKEIRYLRAKGTITYSTSGKPVMMFGTNWDVTKERLLTQQVVHEKERLLISENNFRLLVKNAPDAIIMVNSKLMITLVNKVAEEIFEYPHKTLIGQAVSNLVVVDSRTEFTRILNDAFDPEKQPGKNIEFNGQRQNGMLFQFELNLQSIDIEGEAHIILTLRDITDRKLFETQLQKVRENLERSNKELQQFAYVASHDLREPLRTIGSYIQLLERRYNDEFDADAKDFMHYITDGVSRMQRLIDDLLIYSRVTTKAKPNVIVDCNQVLKQVLFDLQMQIQEKNAVVTVDHLPTIQADDLQLARVFQNLISNSIKFCEQTPKIQVGVEETPEMWVFFVKDNGIGIDPKYFDRIFTIFQRLHESGKYSGTGIGLATCKKIVERHGGRIWVESQAGQGSTFYFTIPK